MSEITNDVACGYCFLLLICLVCLPPLRCVGGKAKGDIFFFFWIRDIELIASILQLTGTPTAQARIAFDWQAPGNSIFQNPN